jgi:hypothetical protein
MAALVDLASGAEAAAIEVPEAVGANLRRAADARVQLAPHVPPEMLRQILMTRPQLQQTATGPAAGDHDGLPS